MFELCNVTKMLLNDYKNAFKRLLEKQNTAGILDN